MTTLSKVNRVFRRLFRREISYYLVKPTNLLLFLTYRCTSHCKTCTMWQRKVQEPELTLEQWKNFIDMASSYNIGYVEMFGGDALLRKEVLIELTRYIKKCGIPQVDLTTNGNLLDEAMAWELVESGLDVITVSLDGVGELHDSIRGVSGLSEKIKKGIGYLIKARNGKKNPKIVINCTISRLNINGFEKVVPFSEEAGVDLTAFEYVGEFPKESLCNSVIEGIEPKPYFISGDSSLLLDRQQSVFLKQKLKDLKKQYKKSKSELVTVNIDALRIKDLVSGHFSNKKCYVCRHLITVDPYGNIIPCPFFNNYSLDNFRKKDLKMIWNNQRHKYFIHHRDSGKLKMCNYCILGVERNPTFFRGLKKGYLSLIGKGYDE